VEEQFSFLPNFAKKNVSFSSFRKANPRESQEFMIFLPLCTLLALARCLQSKGGEKHVMKKTR